MGDKMNPIKKVWLASADAVVIRWEPGNGTSYHVSVTRADGRLFVCVGNFGIGTALTQEAVWPTFEPTAIGYLCEKFSYDRIADIRELGRAISAACRIMETITEEG